MCLHTVAGMNGEEGSESSGSAQQDQADDHTALHQGHQTSSRSPVEHKTNVRKKNSMDGKEEI